jgi:dTDP-4-dehydrorhamnose 3,5-epimerase-like enzyme
MIKLIDLPKIIDKRGNLTFVQKNIGIPFEIQRIFWTYDVAAGEVRGGHAYKKQNEVIGLISGSADILFIYENGEKQKISLNRPDKAVFVPAGVWRQLENFSTNAVSIHFSDSSFDSDDYIRDLNTFIK